MLLKVKPYFISTFLIVIGILGILAELIILFDLNFENNSELFDFMSKINFIRFFDFNPRFFSDFNGNSWWKIRREILGIGISVNLLNIYFYVICLMSAIVFKYNRAKIQGFVIFLFSYFFIFSCFGILVSIINTSIRSLNNKFDYIGYFFVYLIISSFFAIFSYTVIKYLLQENSLDILKDETVRDTSKKMRLLNMVFDSIFISLFFVSFYNSLDTILFQFNNEAFSQNVDISVAILLFLPFRFLYFFIFEASFGYSPAKFITNSRLITGEFEKPSGSTVFKRTLCRFIPFDNISFLGKNGWHDKFSDTYVVNEKSAAYKPVWYLLVLLLPLFISLFILGFDMWQKKKDDNTFLEDRKKYEAIQQMGRINNLIPKDIICLSSDKINRIKGAALRIKSVSNDSIYCYLTKLEGSDSYLNLEQIDQVFDSEIQMGHDKIYSISKIDLIKSVDREEKLTIKKSKINLFPISTDRLNFQKLEINSIGNDNNIDEIKIGIYNSDIEVREAKILEGDIKISPQNISLQNNGSSYSSGTINIIRKTERDKIIVELTIRNNNNFSNKYHLVGNKQRAKSGNNKVWYNYSLYLID